MALARADVVVVGVRFLANHAVNVRPQGDLLVSQLGILALLVDRGVDDLLLLVGDLQAVGLGVLRRRSSGSTAPGTTRIRIFS